MDDRPWWHFGLAAVLIVAAVTVPAIATAPRNETQAGRWEVVSHQSEMNVGALVVIRDTYDGRCFGLVSGHPLGVVPCIPMEIP